MPCQETHVTWSPRNHGRTQSAPAGVLDELSDRESVETVRFLESLEGLDRGSHIARIARTERDQLSHGPTVPGDNEELAHFHALKQLREACPRIRTSISGTVLTFLFSVPVHSNQTLFDPICLRGQLHEKSTVRRATRRAVPCPAILNSLLPHHARRG